MKAFVTPSGILNIVPETETEEYALIQWKGNALLRIDGVEPEEDWYFRGSRLSIPNDIHKP